MRQLNCYNQSMFKVISRYASMGINKELAAAIRSRQLRKLARLQQLELNTMILKAERKAKLHAPKKLLNPLVAKYIKETKKTSNIVVTFLNVAQKAQAGGYAGSVSLLNNFNFGGIILAAIDFVRIPLIYLGAYLLNEKVPISLSKNLRFIYSGVLLGLVITSLVFPPAAFVISFIVFSAAFVFSCSLLTKALYNRYNFQQKLLLYEQQINAVIENIELLKVQAYDLHEALKEADKSESNDDISDKIFVLDEQLKQNEQELEELCIRRFQTQLNIDHYDKDNFFGKASTVIIASLTLTSVALTVFFPPIGLAVLAAAGFFALTAFTVQITRSVLKSRNDSQKNISEETEQEQEFTCSTKSTLEKIGKDKNAEYVPSEPENINLEVVPVTHKNMGSAFKLMRQEEEKHKVPTNTLKR